ACALASRMACRSEPLPLSLMFVTTKTAGARRGSSASTVRGDRWGVLVRVVARARRVVRKRRRNIVALRSWIGRESDAKQLKRSARPRQRDGHLPPARLRRGRDERRFTHQYSKQAPMSSPTLLRRTLCCGGSALLAEPIFPYTGSRAEHSQPGEAFSG